MIGIVIIRFLSARSALRQAGAAAFLAAALFGGAVWGAPAAWSAAELRVQLETHVSQPRFNAAIWSVKVASLSTGRTLFEHQADRLMSPASNSKLYTAAAALDHLGGDYRILTPVFATSRPDAEGRVAGNITVSGRGDPGWKTDLRTGDFWPTFAPFVALLEQAGVRQISGDIVADATFFRGPPYGSGWSAGDLNDDYGAEISAITLEDNYADLRVTPGAAVGAPCRLELVQPCTGLILHNQTMTSRWGSGRSLQAWRAPGMSVVYIFGELPAGGAEELLDLPVPQPAGWFAAGLKEALIRAGIRVGGESRCVYWPAPVGQASSAVKLGEIASAPLADLVKAFMKPSQNLETDLIFAHLGETLRPPDAPPWRTSEECAVAGLQEFLRRHKLPVEEVRFEEGSGLSRNNVTTANATVALLSLMAKHRDAEAFNASLPIAGVDGTLRRRMTGTLAAGNVRAKTGTLRWANSLSGYVTSAAGERLAFSVMLNRAVVPAGRVARDEVDAIALMLAAFAGKSDETEISRADPK